jgi:hypothetical protein
MRSTTGLQHQVPSIQKDRRAAMRVALAAALSSLAACQTIPSAQTESAFPVVGRRLLVTFPAFRTELHFHSASALTWYLLNPDGTKGRSETVEIRIQPVVDKIFLVTWQEANKTTVVQVEDFERKVILTNVTRSDGTFLQSKGTFVEMS